MNGEFVTLLTMAIDHIIPESLATNSQRLHEVLTKFGLGDDFELNSYENWLPSCGACNRAKRNRVFECTPIIQEQLDRAREKAQEARDFADQSLSERQTARLLTDLDRAFNVSPDDVKASALAKRIAAENPLYQHGISIKTDLFSLEFSSNSTGAIATKESFFDKDGEYHVVTALSSLGGMKVTFREGGITEPEFLMPNATATFSEPLEFFSLLRLSNLRFEFGGEGIKVNGHLKMISDREFFPQLMLHFNNSDPFGNDGDLKRKWTPTTETVEDD
ncbi:hypothetical protein GFL92_01040 [Rhizobium leguminosarum bv. viciae]|nr:hypothetical protein [Rhizobium leguminosarum bv. viciae]